MLMIWEMIIAGMGGLLIQMLMKGKSLSEKATVNNEKFSFAKYICHDWLSIAISIAGIFLAAYILRRRFAGAVEDTEAAELILVTCATFGYSGGDLFSRIFGVYSKRLNAIADIKSNIADYALGRDTKNLEDLKERGSAVMMTDVTQPPDFKNNAG